MIDWAKLLKEGLNTPQKTREEKTIESEELEKKKRDIERQIEEVKKTYEDDIKRIESNPLIKPALKILNKKSRVKTRQELNKVTDYYSKANELGKTIYQRNSSRYLTFSELLIIEDGIKTLAKEIERKIDRFPDKDEPSEYKLIRGVREKTKESLPSFLASSEYSEVRHLNDFAKQISFVADWYYNHHRISENKAFVSDDDPKVTPLNFFSMKRISEFIRLLEDDQKRMRYLLQMKNAFLDEDKRGFTHKNGVRVFAGQFSFLKELEKAISVYSQTNSIGEQLLRPVNDSESARKNSDNQSDIPLRSPAKHNKQGSQKEIFYLLEVIFRKLGYTGSNTAKGNVMSFLSGYSSESMRQSFSLSEESPTATDRWTNEQKSEALEAVYKFAAETKMNTIAKDIKEQLDKLRSKKH